MYSMLYVLVLTATLQWQYLIYMKSKIAKADFLRSNFISNNVSHRNSQASSVDNMPLISVATSENNKQ